MAILIKNPEVERKARELASLRGLTITSALNDALERALAEAKAPAKRRPTAQEILEATRRFRAPAGLPDDLPPVTSEDFDALWEDDR